MIRDAMVAAASMAVGGKGSSGSVKIKATGTSVDNLASSIHPGQQGKHIL